jgi:hypothetical protein
MTHTPMQREVPILFSGPMVEAILAGRKTQTRRQWSRLTLKAYIRSLTQVKTTRHERVMETCKYRVGDLLWVKDRLFMPKAQAKIWLEVMEVRYEHLKAITEADALAEGIERMGDDGEVVYGTYERKRGKVQRTGWHSDPRHSFATLIDAVCGTGTWMTNSTLWVISFKVISTTGRP